MPDAVLFVSLLAACYLGFALLALSQDRHWRRVGRMPQCPFRALVLMRLAGCGLLAFSLALAIVLDGPGFGSLLGTAILTNGALAVVCTLTWRPHWLRPLARLFQHVN